LNFYHTASTTLSADQALEMPPYCTQSTNNAPDEGFLRFLPNSAPACPDKTESITEDTCTRVDLWFESNTCSFRTHVDLFSGLWLYDGATTCCPDACCDLDNYARQTISSLSSRSVQTIQYLLKSNSPSISVFTDPSCETATQADVAYSSSAL
jgi:hypothetical protein